MIVNKIMLEEAGFKRVFVIDSPVIMLNGQIMLATSRRFGNMQEIRNEFETEMPLMIIEGEDPSTEFILRIFKAKEREAS